MGTTAGVGETPHGSTTHGSAALDGTKLDGTTAVDLLALPLAAARLDAAAEIISAIRRIHLAGLRSTPPVDELVAAVTRWESAVRGIAAGLRTAAGRYAESEAQAAESLR